MVDGGDGMGWAERALRDNGTGAVEQANEVSIVQAQCVRWGWCGFVVMIGI